MTINLENVFTCCLFQAQPGLIRQTENYHTNYLILAGPENIQQFDAEGKILACNEARAHFALTGYHFNPDQVTQHLSIQS